jgi:uncharacterized protein with GYD domain
MPQYLGRFAYTADAVRALVENPQDRAAAASEAVESLGGKLLGFWFSFGEFDGVYVAEVPDNATALSIAMAVAGTGTLARLETTVLIGMEEAQEAMRKAATATYRAPAG